MPCYYNFVKAESVEITTDAAGDYITITVPATETFEDGFLSIGLFTTIPTTLANARIVVTNGTDSLPILRMNGNYWRPTLLRGRSILRCVVLSDPAHLLIGR